MRKIILLFILSFCFSVGICQPRAYWQQSLEYNIKVSLNDVDNTLDAVINIQYQNNSPDTLHFIWMHLWPNAFKNDRTAFSDQLLENGRTDFYFSEEKDRGYINRLNFKVDSVPALLEDHPVHQDIVKLILPKPLAPGNSIQVETAFHEKIPFNFSRGGFTGNAYQITQWYPKPAVYDVNGWHEMAYLDQGETYNEFGNYKVTITVPENYKVAATGNLLSETKVGHANSFQFYQANVTDFAWFADKNIIEQQDSLKLTDKDIRIKIYHSPGENAMWDETLKEVKSSINAYCSLVGEYPYDVISVLENKSNSTATMNYPTLVLVKPGGTAWSRRHEIYREVGQQWFSNVLASNARVNPWMSEGMNGYYFKRLLSENDKNAASVSPGDKDNFIKKRSPLLPNIVNLQTALVEKKDQPINTGAEFFSKLNAHLIAEDKAALWMDSLEKKMGTPAFDKAMQAYYLQWKFKHPNPQDFKTIAEKVSEQNLDEQFLLLGKKGELGKPAHKDLKLASFFNLRETNKYNYISVAPAVGYNIYDKLMLGMLVHNYQLPPNKFQFIVAPLFATGSHTLNGMGRMSYSIYPGKNAQKLEIAIAAEKFTAAMYKDSTGKNNYMPFSKIAPSIKYIFANANPRSSITKYLQWKTFFINETSLLFTTDTVQQIDIISYPVAHRYVNQLRFVFENTRTLYPYNACIQMEQGKDFARAAFTGNYYFNYPKGGGLNVRVFGGKFFYLGDKTFVKQFETDAYHLNMSGPKGYEDYTYSNYFIGRNEFDGLASQQLMLRDGAFKVHTDLLNNKIGKTDDWLTAVNFTSDIPRQINPLSLLPVKIPIKIFADFGTYAEAWKLNAPTGKLLYDAGLQVSLFSNVLNIYVPILYSKVYDNYFKSVITEKRFVKNISFSIDVQNFSVSTILKKLGL